MKSVKNIIKIFTAQSNPSISATDLIGLSKEDLEKIDNALLSKSAYAQNEKKRKRARRAYEKWKSLCMELHKIEGDVPKMEGQKKAESKKEMDTNKLTKIIFGTIILGFIGYVFIAVNIQMRGDAAQKAANDEYAESRGGYTNQQRSKYQYFRSGSFGESSYVSRVSLPDESAYFTCNTPRNDRTWDIPIYFLDSRDGESGKFENRPRTRKALSRCSNIEYIDQFEFEIEKAKILYKECGSEPSEICFTTKFIPSIQGLSCPEFSICPIK